MEGVQRKEGVRAKSKSDIEGEMVGVVASALRGVDGAVVLNYPVWDRGVPGVMVSVSETVEDELSGTFLVTVARISTAVSEGNGNGS